MSFARDLSRLGRTGIPTFQTAQALRGALVFSDDPPEAAVTLGAVTAGDGGGGLWRWDSTSVEDDNLGTILKPVDTAELASGRWKRANYREVYTKFFGSVDSRTIDSTSAIIAANAEALAKSLPLVLQGEYRTTQTIVFTAQTVICDAVYILKDLDDTEVVRFQGNAGGGTSKFEHQVGRLTVGQSAQPANDQINAHGIVLDSVLGATFDDLRVLYSAYGIIVDETASYKLCWGNVFNNIKIRGCVQGFIDWRYSGVQGAHTGNYFARIYLNGYDANSLTPLPKQDVPVRINTTTAFTIGVLNFEWVEVADGGDFIYIQNQGSIGIENLHFEGNNHTTDDIAGIFKMSNSGVDTPTNIFVGNMVISGITQSSGTLALLNATTISEGNLHIRSFTGNKTGSTITDFRLLSTSGNAKVIIGENSQIWSFVTDTRQGTYPTNKMPNIYIGGKPEEGANKLDDPGATIDLGGSHFIRVGGTQSEPISTINSTQAHPKEYSRRITIQNNTAAGIPLLFTSGGNIRKPQWTTWDLSVTRQSNIVLEYNYLKDYVDVIGYG